MSKGGGGTAQVAYHYSSRERKNSTPRTQALGGRDQEDETQSVGETRLSLPAVLCNVEIFLWAFAGVIAFVAGGRRICPANSKTSR